MKISVSLSEDDVAALDRFVTAAGLGSRSAGLRQAIRRLGDAELEEAYVAAWEEWADSGDAAAWDSVTGDGLTHAAR